MSDAESKAVPLQQVLEAEHSEIDKIRQRRKSDAGKSSAGMPRPPAAPPDAPIAGRAPAPADEPEWQTRDGDWVKVTIDAHNRNLVGLAFSGGGIRSATFNLGVLQALADLKLLYRVDYLSTVSGGGYIGSWLAAWTKRLGSFAEVQQRLAPNRVHQQDDREPTPIRFLRMFSNYLTPKLGIFSGDTWAMVAIYLRNLLLNLVVVIAMVTTLLLVPHAVGRLALDAQGTRGIGVELLVAVAVLLAISFFVILNNMTYLDSRRHKGAPPLTQQNWILRLVGAPLLIAAILAVVWEAVNRQSLPLEESAYWGAAAYGLFWALPVLGSWVWLGWRGTRRGSPPFPDSQPAPGLNLYRARNFTITLLAAIVAGAFAGGFYAFLSRHALTWLERLTTGVPIVLGIFLLAGTVHIGLMGVAFRDWKREWWGRLGGWLLLWGLAWLAIFWIALYFPPFIHNDALVKSAWKTVAAKYLTPAWILTTVAGVLAGKSGDSGNKGRSVLRGALVSIGPYVFLTGLLCLISYGIWEAEGWIKPHLWWAILGGIALTVLMSWRVDINQFSLHSFYRNRLVRCYLGASNEGRDPNRFTGFDSTDDVALKDLRADAGYDGPYPVLNMALNLVKGKDLAWQQRKAESFVMTPRYCGYDVWLEEQDSPMLRDQRSATGPGRLDRYGYRPTEEYAFPARVHGHGPNLGFAMAISGAAASPNMGFYTSAPVAFLMTVFDVRLGQWLGNPRQRSTWKRPTPTLGLPYLVKELMAGTNDESRYVYLSDGGHFDNMGLYELVKRRCGLIILCDAEADEGYQFAGLANAIRICRIDLGVDIKLDVNGIAPAQPGGTSRTHCAIGTIHYENTDLQAPTGTILYFKASLTGDEPTDVANYKKKHPAFPHESTADQWFSESQFENYRQLGYHEVMTSLRGTVAGPSPLEKQLKEIFTTFGFDTTEVSG
jgi:hypothetical protein